MTSRPYGDAAAGYLEAGWAGVLPVGTRPRLKSEPPKGYTGRDGAWPTPEQVDAWTHDHATSNIALRLPHGVIGIDVDAYDGKLGADTMAAGAAAHGRLPATWVSTSRDDGLSGIRLFRVPDDAEFGGKLEHPERRAQSHVELIQFHHRYAVVAPSIHPEGREYRWLPPADVESWIELPAVPAPADLPELPAAWREHLAGSCDCFRVEQTDVLTFRDPAADPIAERAAEALAALRSPGSRHDGVLQPVLALVGFARRGSREAAAALDDVRVGFLAAVTAPGSNQRSPSEAEREWRRMTEQGKAATAGAGQPAWEERTPPAATVAAKPVVDYAAARIDAAALLRLELQPLRWLVPDLIPEGTTILAAPPKVGKSCLIYQAVVECTIGGELLGRRAASGSALYLALEDGKRRGQDRLRTALHGRTMPEGRLEVWWAAPKIGEGLEDELARWLDGHPDAALVAIDTLGKVRPRGDGRRNAYDVDVELLARLQDLFRDRPVALVIVHHARKEAHDDFLASVSGTYGITGSADTTLVLRRLRTEAFGTINVTGRDVADATVSVRFEGGLWQPAPGAIGAATFERREVFDVIDRHGPIFPAAIAAVVGKTRQNVDNMVRALVDSGTVMRTDGGVVAELTFDELARARVDHVPGVSRVSDVSDVSQQRETPEQLEQPGTPARARDGEDPGEGTTVIELPALRVVPDEPPDLLAGPARPPCYSDPALFRAHASDQYNLQKRGAGLSGMRGRLVTGPLVAWIAGRDGEAHARRPNYPTAMCGAPRIREYLAWPEETRCPVCIRLAAVYVAEQRPARGGRTVTMDEIHYAPMTRDVADELMAGIADVILAQPPELRDRIRLAIDSGTWDLVAATPDQLVINVRGVGELLVARIPVVQGD